MFEVSTTMGSLVTLVFYVFLFETYFQDNPNMTPLEAFIRTYTNHGIILGLLILDSFFNNIYFNWQT